jgi:ankyrin repeat protein
MPFNLPSLKNIPYSELENEISEAIKANDNTKVKYLLQHPHIKKEDKIQHHMDRTFVMACKFGNLELAKSLLSFNAFELIANINNESALISASENNHLNIVKYILTHPEFIPQLAISNEAALYVSCLKGNIDIINYIYSLPEIKEIYDFEIKPSSLLNLACTTNKVNMVNYLLNSPYLKNDITNYDINQAFISACRKKQKDVIIYFIFEYNIEKTYDIEVILNFTDDIEVKNLFNARELNNILNIELNCNSSKNLANRKQKL